MVIYKKKSTILWQRLGLPPGCLFVNGGQCPGFELFINAGTIVFINLTRSGVLNPKQYMWEAHEVERYVVQIVE